MGSLVSERDVKHFRRHGWLHVPGCLTQEQVDTLRAALDRGLVAPPSRELQTDKSAEVLTMVRELWRHYEEVRPICLDRRLGEMVRELLGVEHVRLFSEAFLNKPPHGRPTPWHQDWSVQPFDRRDSLNVYVALDDMTPEQGAIQVVSGSHRLGPTHTPHDLDHEVPLERALLAEDVELLWHLAAGDDLEIEGVPVRRSGLAAGDALVWHGLTIHGAPPNRTDRPRRAYTRTWIGADVRYTGMPYPVAGFTDPVPERAGLSAGQPFETDRYPVVA